MSNFAQGILRATYTFPAQREEKLLNPIKSRKKLLKSRGICGFIFVLFCLLHTRNWLLFISHVIPRLSRFSPIKSRSALIFATKSIFLSRKLHNFCSIFVAFSGFEGFLWTFLALGRDSGLIFERIFYIFYYILYYIFTYLSPSYFLFSTIY